MKGTVAAIEKRPPHRRANRWLFLWLKKKRRASVLRKTLKILVADAVAVEPVSSPHFPTNRERNREFRDFQRKAAFLRAHIVRILCILCKIPYSLEQGISEQQQGSIE
jgi:hypothetical protein